jgi:feruloyl esterase
VEWQGSAFYFAVQQLFDLDGVALASSLRELQPLSLANNIEFLRHFPKLNGFNGLGIYGRGASPAGNTPLVEINEFGTNPGALRMFSFVPEHLQRAPALVVVLHGCGQTAAAYDFGTGWSTLAKRYGFALLLPEQRGANNANTCFNWFNPDDVTRGRGEAGSIRQMIARMVADHRIDPRRIYITGLSAGGAMTSVMLANYPEVFAGGAIIAGLPFGIASNLREALGGMMQSSPRSAAELGEFVRKASKHRGPWPKVSVWHGSADRTVHPGNADEIVKQWLDVHRLPVEPMSSGVVDGHPRDVWWDADGATMLESYSITDMAHGTPLGLAGDDSYGATGAFLLEAGISSSYHIANFFGLTDRVSQAGEAIDQPAEGKAIAVAPTVPSPATAALRSPALAATLWPRARPARQTRPQAEVPKRRGIDVGEVITRALTAAGLMK